MNKKQIMGFLGSIFLFIGVFAPLIRMPILGNMNYIQSGKGDGIIIIFLAVISFILTIIKKYKGLWFTGIGSLGVIAFTFINLQIIMTTAKAQIETELAENLFKGVADLLMQSVQLQYGWVFLIIGVILIITTAVIKR